MGVSQVLDDDEVMFITDGGKVLRCRVDTISTMGRATQGVRIMNLNEGELLVAVARLAEGDEAGAREHGRERDRSEAGWRRRTAPDSHPPGAGCAPRTRRPGRASVGSPSRMITSPETIVAR